MNLNSVQGYFSQTDLLTAFQKKKKKLLGINNLKSSPASTTKAALVNSSTQHLPFLVKVTFIKTIRSTIPQVTYQYILPEFRRERSLRYEIFLKKHSPASNPISLNSIYKSTLKI